MKLLPINTQKRVNTEDSLGHGMDAVIMLVLFLLAGFGLDRLFGTMPLFMIVMTVIVFAVIMTRMGLSCMLRN